MNYSKVLHYFFTKDVKEKNSSSRRKAKKVDKTFVTKEDIKLPPIMIDNVEEMPCSRPSPSTIPDAFSLDIEPTPATNESPGLPGDVKIEDATPQTLKSLAYKMRTILETKNKTISQLQRKNRQQVKQIEKLNLLVKQLRKQNRILETAAQPLSNK